MSNSIADETRAIRTIFVAGLNPCTYKSWVGKIMNFLSLIPVNNLHVTFDNYRCE